jgi:two-component system response regulator FixJ
MSAQVYIVDDDPAIRDALGKMLSDAGLRVQSYADGDAFLATSLQRRPACVVLDVALPGMSGYEVQETLNQRGLQIPIIFLTGHGDVPMAVKAIQAGAVDFLEKPVRRAELLRRVQRALELDTRHHKDEQAEHQVMQAYARLSPREQEVMALVVAGLSSKEIARQLGVSSRTVHTHRAHVMLKMQAANVAELVRMAGICGT